MEAFNGFVRAIRRSVPPLSPATDDHLISKLVNQLEHRTDQVRILRAKDAQFVHKGSTVYGHNEVFIDVGRMNSIAGMLERVAPHRFATAADGLYPRPSAAASAAIPSSVPQSRQYLTAEELLDVHDAVIGWADTVVGRLKTPV